MRIMILAQFYPPILGGEERHVKTLSEALAARGHTVSVVTIGHGDDQEMTVEGNVTIYRIRGLLQRFPWLFSPGGRQHAPPFPDPELTTSIDRIVRLEQPDVVHAHNWLVYSYLPLKHRHRAKLVLTLHDYGLVCPKKSMMREGRPCEDRTIADCVPCASRHYGPLKGSVTALSAVAARRSALNKVDRFIAVSDAVAQRCALRGTCHVETIPNFISNSVPTAQPTAGERKLAEQLPTGDFILFVGDLMTLKGLPTLLEAHSRLTNPWPLVLIGRRCADTPTQLLKGVSIFESWPHGAVLEAWRRCTFGVLPSTGLEACATVVMEANAMAKPMIVSRTGGLPEIVEDGVTGLLVPPGNAGLLAAAMQTLMDNHVLRQRMSEASQRKSRTLMADAVVPQIENVYFELTSQPAGRLTDRDDASTRIPANV